MRIPSYRLAVDSRRERDRALATVRDEEGCRARSMIAVLAREGARVILWFLSPHS